MKCKCGSKRVYTEDGYETIFRCLDCNKVGNINDFEEE